MKLRTTGFESHHFFVIRLRIVEAMRRPYWTLGPAIETTAGLGISF